MIYEPSEHSRQISDLLLKKSDEIVEKINKTITDNDADIRKYLAFWLGYNYGTAENIIRYEWYYDRYQTDYSGELNKDGYMTADASLKEVLEMYTGRWEATYESGYGKRWITIEDEMSYETLDIADTILSKVIRKNILAIDPEISEDEIRDIIDEVFDEIYEKSVAIYFFFGYPYFSEEELSLPYNSFLQQAKNEVVVVRDDTAVIWKDIDYFWFRNRFCK